MKRNPFWCGLMLVSCLLLCFAGCGSDSQTSESSSVEVNFADGSPARVGESWTLKGNYEGILSPEHSLWAVVEKDGAYHVLPPAIQLDEKTKSWSHPAFRLEPGRWNLHILDCNKSSHEMLMLAGHLSGLPSGATRLKTVPIEYRAQTEVSPDLPSPPNGTPPQTPSPVVEKAYPVAIAAPSEPLPAISAEDRILIQFDKPLDDLRLKHSFGIFRDDTQPRDFQDIEEFDAIVPLANGETTRAMRLHYSVTGRGSYNGWWLDLAEADWTDHAQDNLVLRVRFGKTGEDCTKVFKLELKTDPGERVHPVVVRAQEQHLEEQNKQGFCDIVIPIKDIVEQDLSQMVQLVLVFEQRRVDTYQGDLFLHSLRISPAAGN